MEEDKHPLMKPIIPVKIYPKKEYLETGQISFNKATNEIIEDNNDKFTTPELEKKEDDEDDLERIRKNFELDNWTTTILYPSTSNQKKGTHQMPKKLNIIPAESKIISGEECNELIKNPININSDEELVEEICTISHFPIKNEELNEKNENEEEIPAEVITSRIRKY